LTLCCTARMPSVLKLVTVKYGACQQAGKSHVPFNPSSLAVFLFEGAFLTST